MSEDYTVTAFLLTESQSEILARALDCAARNIMDAAPEISNNDETCRFLQGAAAHFRMRGHSPATTYTIKLWDSFWCILPTPDLTVKPPEPQPRMMK
jgi:hypothetical protein